MAANVKNTQTSALDQSIKVQTTPSEDVDRASSVGKTRSDPSNWTKYNSYYKNHISVKSVIDKIKMWSVGKGFKADDETTKILKKIVGWGKESFNDVIKNQIGIKHANGDSYAEIITTDGEFINDDGSNLLNLKPLNPGVMINVVNEAGILIGYEEMDFKGEKVLNEFEPEEIFHLVMNRDADEIHGTGDIQALITFLDKIKQVDEDMSVMFHRFVVPLVIWVLNTDDETAMTKFKNKSKIVRNSGDDMVISDKAVEWSLLEPGKGVGKVIDPMTWRNKWVEEVIKGGGVPALIMAIEAGTTEASSKMVYLAWQQVIEDEQLSTEDQVLAQLHLTIKYEFPARIEENLGEDEGKDGDINTGKKSEVKIETKSVDQKSTKPPA